MNLKKLIRRAFQKIDGQRIPGINAFGDGEWAYFLPRPGVDQRKQFRALVSQVAERRAKSGGFGEAGACVTLPDGRTFYGLYYRGDVRGWCADLSESSQRQSIVLVRFKGRRFVVDGGKSYNLKDLNIEVF